jgi:GNAT superfamily N-acetyltransferase
MLWPTTLRLGELASLAMVSRQAMVHAGGPRGLISSSHMPAITAPGSPAGSESVFKSVFEVRSEAEIASTFDVMAVLRPHLHRTTYVAAVTRMMATGFRLVTVRAGGMGAERVVAAAGFRVTENLAWGRYLYVDDLVTAEGERSMGHGKLLFDWLKGEARAAGCGELHLDSGVFRHGAHRFYLRERMDITSYHFRLSLT